MSSARYSGSKDSLLDSVTEKLVGDIRYETWTVWVQKHIPDPLRKGPEGTRRKDLPPPLLNPLFLIFLSDIGNVGVEQMSTVSQSEREKTMGNI